MRLKNIFAIIALTFVAITGMSFVAQKTKPTLYIIGDSTVKNGSGKGSDSLWGWGSHMGSFLDTLKIDIQNHAMGGRSSRTFLTEGRWEKVLQTLKKGDYVMIQFGHNDGGPLDDEARARGTIQGTGTDSTEIYNPIRKVKEVVHTYGWYMTKYVKEAKAKGATVVICSPIPRSDFDDKGKMKKDKYAVWAKEVATKTGASFIPLNDLVIAEYEKIGEAATKKYFPKDHTHTNGPGALLNAKIIAGAIKKDKVAGLDKYLKK
ncbi:lysophospholipase [Flavobacterium sp. Sd200]|uniref:rhamnogalacturonan acetylesterase n=1 Tax=Flavobacterium sp. Sd200 TaxID=2692211 RepID=UPI00136CEDC7|nr:rhamnogalacturonan acetylesterase [Flavobacterium sp. Sd200]MXN90839.1 lysophospholipase [Flavobacterium sp. Sd200]